MPPASTDASWSTPAAPLSGATGRAKPRVFGGDTGDHCIEEGLEFICRLYLGDAVGEPEQKPSQEIDHCDRLFADQVTIQRLTGGCTCATASSPIARNVSINPLKHGTQFRVTRGDHHEFESRSRSRSFGLDGGPHRLQCELRQQGLGVIVVCLLGGGHRGCEVGDVL